MPKSLASKKCPASIGDDLMTRFLIFAVLFPAVATVSFYAVMYIATGAAQDGGLGPVFMYLFFIVPGLLVALLDWLVARTSMPAIATTTVLAYGLSVLALTLLLGASPQIVVLGLIGAIPAGVCSWLSDRPEASATA
jgi:hypothetical protein